MMEHSAQFLSLFLSLTLTMGASVAGFATVSIERPHRIPRWDVEGGAPCVGAPFESYLVLRATTSPLSSISPEEAPPRAGLTQWLLDAALRSPLWKHVLVPQARQKIIQTAKDNGIDWNYAYDWITSEEGPWSRENENVDSSHEYPSYYVKPFHAYEKGNLCWQSALESEIASCAVGARNFPLYGSQGEEAFRSAFEATLVNDLQVTVPSSATLVDLGCGTGVSTRRLAKSWPQAERIVGVDMSPYFIAVGQRLLELSPKSMLLEKDSGSWVHSIDRDDRIELRVGDASKTDLPSASADVVNVQFVVHELPHEVAKSVVDEAYRLLKPGGQLWLCEMDFEAPAYAKQRANALLFSLIRATEPYLDAYAESETQLRRYIAHKFVTTTVTAATGRHYALLAIKPSGRAEDTRRSNGVLNDLRFLPDGTFRVEDTHLKVWESKHE